MSTLDQFVFEKMRTSAAYQPMIIIGLLNNNGLVHVKQLSGGNSKLEKALTKYPPQVLFSHGIATFDKGTFFINPSLVIQNREAIIKRCEEIIREY